MPRSDGSEAQAIQVLSNANAIWSSESRRISLPVSHCLIADWPEPFPRSPALNVCMHGPFMLVSARAANLKGLVSLWRSDDTCAY